MAAATHLYADVRGRRSGNLLGAYFVMEKSQHGGRVQDTHSAAAATRRSASNSSTRDRH